MKWFVYILRSTSTDTLYTGMTKDTQRREKQHNDGKGAKFTRNTGPWKLVYVEEHPTQGDALRREAVIKKMARARKLTLIEAKPKLSPPEADQKPRRKRPAPRGKPQPSPHVPQDDEKQSCDTSDPVQSQCT